MKLDTEIKKGRQQDEFRNYRKETEWYRTYI